MVAAHISRDEVVHVARLARLELAEHEVDLYVSQLSAILGHASAIAALDLSEIPPTSHPLPVQNVFRLDEVGDTLERDEVLAAAPAVEDGRFMVPRILDES